jgi:hypothetical protein
MSFHQASEARRQEAEEAAARRKGIRPDFRTDYFHVDSNGNTCFSAAEAKLATTRVREMRLLDHIKVWIYIGLYPRYIYSSRS